MAFYDTSTANLWWVMTGAKDKIHCPSRLFMSCKNPLFCRIQTCMLPWISHNLAEWSPLKDIHCAFNRVSITVSFCFLPIWAKGILPIAWNCQKLNVYIIDLIMVHKFHSNVTSDHQPKISKNLNYLVPGWLSASIIL